MRYHKVIAGMLAIVMILSITLGSISKAGANEMIVNGSFDAETGMLSGWSVSGDVTAEKGNGAHAVLTGGDMALLQSDTYLAAAEENYKLSFSVRLTGDAIFKATVLQFDGETQSVAGDLIVPLPDNIHTAEWETVEYTFCAAADVNALAVSFEVIAGVAQIDNVSMKCLYRDVRYTPQGQEVEIENGSFYKKLDGWIEVDGKASSISEGYFGKGVLITTKDGIGRVAQDGIHLEPDSLYELHYYIKATDATGFESSVVIELLDGGEVRRIKPCFLEGNSLANGWQEMTAQFTTGDIEETAKIELLVERLESEKLEANVAFDEIILTKLNFESGISMMLLKSLSNTSSEIQYSFDNVKWPSPKAKDYFEPSQETDSVHGPVYKVTSKAASSSDYVLRHNINWEAGKTYVISYWMKTDSDMGKYSLYPRVSSGGTNYALSTMNWLTSQPVRNSNKVISDWKEYRFEVTIGAAGSTSVLDFLYGMQSAGDVLYLTGIKIEKKLQGFTNGTFTDGIKDWEGVSADQIKDGVAAGAQCGNALQVIKPASENKQVTHVPITKPVERRKTYTLKFRGRNDALVNQNSNIGSVYLKDASGSILTAAEKILYPTNGIWADYVVDFVPDKTYTELILCLDMMGAEQITYTFSDFSFGEYEPIVVNGDFAKELTGWTVRWNGSTTKPEYSESSVSTIVDSIYGNAMHVRKYKSDTSLTDIYMTLNEKLAVGSVYKISFKIKNSLPTNSDQAGLDLYVRSNGQTTTKLMTDNEDTNQQWKEYSLEYAVEEGWEQPNFQFRCRTGSGLESDYLDYYIADVKIERTAKTVPALVRNGTFSTTVHAYPSFWGVIGETVAVTKGVATITKETDDDAGITTLLNVYENVPHELRFDLKADAKARELLSLHLTPYLDELRNKKSDMETLFIELNLKDTDDWQTVVVPFDVAKEIVYMDMSLLCEGQGEAQFSIDNAIITFDEETSLNFDFEIGRDTPLFWSCTAGMMQRVKESYDLSYAVKISNSKGGQLTSKWFALEADADYELSYMIKADQKFDAFIYPKLNQQDQEGKGANSWIYSSTDPYRKQSSTLAPTFFHYTYGGTISEENSDGWQQVRVSFHTSKDAAKGNVQFQLSGTADEIWIDHIQLKQKQADANLDFEKVDADGNPEGWYLGSVRDSNPEMTVVDDVYHSGNKSLYLNVDTLYGALLTSSCLIPLNTAGNRNVYEMSFWVASRNADVGSIQMELWYYDEEGVKIYSKTVSSAGASLSGVRNSLNSGSEISEWSQIITRSAIPSEVKYVALVLRYTGGGACEIWLDDLCFGQVEADDDVIVVYDDFHAKDQDGNIGGWNVVDDKVNSVPVQLNQLSNDVEGYYGQLESSGNHYMHYQTNTMGTGYTYELAVRYKSDYNVDVQLRFHNYQNQEYTAQRITETLPAVLDWTEATIKFVAPSVTTCDMLFGLQEAGILEISQLVLYQTEVPKDKVSWQGRWLCHKVDTIKSQTYSHSYYRQEVELTSEAVYAPFQFTADDCMVLYVNGVEVFNNINDSIQTWGDIKCLYLEEYLKPGKNVIAFDVYNQAAYSGLVYDGIWTCADEKKVTCISTTDTRVFSEEYDGKVSEGWYKSGFDDSSWQNAIELGYVGVSPWGSLPYDSSLYIENVIEIRAAEGQDAIVNNLVYEFSMDIKTENQITENVPITMGLWVKNSTKSICKLTPTLLTNTDMRKWPVGEWVSVKMRVELPDYLDSGYYTLQLDDTYFAITNEDLFEGRFIDFEVLNNYEATSLITKVEDVNGVPTFIINGTPQPGIFFALPTFNEEAALETCGDSGLETYLNANLRLGKEGNVEALWTETGAIDYDRVDSVINSVLSASSEAYMIVTIGMNAPEWWKEENPDELVLVSDINGNLTYPGGRKYASLGSEKWMAESGEVLEDIVNHMKEQKYWGRIAGFRITGGRTSEFMSFDALDAMSAPDYSKAAYEYFKKWAKEKYGTIEKLREVWNEPELKSFEDIEMPSFAELRSYGTNGILLDPATQQKEIDFRLLLGEMSADSLIYWARIIKTATNNNLIVGSYNGYLFSGGGWTSTSSQHTATQKVLESPYIDFVASPVMYNERNLGESSSPQTVADSVRAYGKLYVSEQDNRTVMLGQFAGGSWDLSRVIGVGNTYTMQDTIYQEKRDTIYNIVEGNAEWLFDLTGGWLADKQIYEFTRDANDEYSFANHVERDVTNDVAIIVPDENAAYLRAALSTDGDGAFGNQSILGTYMFQAQRKELFKSGVGFDIYALSTLTEGKMPEHKINIFYSPYVLSVEDREAINKYCKKNEQINIFLYMSGYGTDEGYSLDNMNALTGFTFGLNNKKSSGQIVVTNNTSKVTEGLFGDVFGVGTYSAKYYVQEIYVEPDKETIELGKLNDSGNVGFALKDMGNWTSIYCAAPLLTADIYRNIFKMANVHIYSEDESNIVWTNSAYIGAHSAASGYKTIYLEDYYAVYDVFEEKYISMNTNVINYYNKRNDTHLFRLMPANTYSFLTMVKGGNGKTSVTGLEQLAPGSEKTVVIEPNEGYEIKSVTVNGEQVDVPVDNILQFSNINENKVIVVKFKREPVPIPVENEEQVTEQPDKDVPQTPDEEEQTGNGGVIDSIIDAYEEIWGTIQHRLHVATWLVWSVLVGAVGMIILLVWIFRKRKEKRERKELGL